jgi:hypothetical protein
VSYYERIRVTAADINRLHARIHETCRHRGRDSASWEQATADFHRYVSPIDALVQRCYAEEFADAPELVNFAVEFLELDPLFFRSGYLKETLLDQLKVAPLTETDKTRLREILKHINRPGRWLRSGYRSVFACVIIPESGTLPESHLTRQGP